MEKITLDVPEKLSEYIQRQVTDQGLKSANDYLLNLIKEDRQAKAEARLAELIMEGMESEPILVTPEFWAEKRARLEARFPTPQNEEAIS